jgi:predicted aspartyl protease
MDPTVALLEAPTGHRLVDVELAGTTRRFLVDSGAGVVVVTPALAADLGLARGRTLEAAAVDGTVTVVLTELDGLSVGGRSFPVLDAVILDLSDPMVHIGPFDGVLGRGFFRETDVLLDLGAATMTVLDPGALADRCPTAPSVRFGFDGGNPQMKVEIAGLRGRTVLDTGANGSLLPTAWAERAGLPIAERSARFSGAAGTMVEAGGADADVVLAGTALGRISFGTHPDERRATLGLDALGTRRVGLSYTSHRLYLPEPGTCD